MKFIRDLLNKKLGKKSSVESGVEPLEESYRNTVGSLSDTSARTSASTLDTSVSDLVSDARKKSETGPVNIWDMDDSGSAPLPAAAAAAPAAPARAPARGRRVKTRLIGFERSDGDVVDLFDEAPKPAQVKRAKFPVAWIVVAEGPGRGESFPLFAGMSSIGRGEDQTVQLDFGDGSISRTNHAAIVFDPDTKEFLLGHGGKSNIVRLNGKPVISNEALGNGDMIALGETKLRFVPLCGEDFDWGKDASGEDDDVAIA